MATLDEMMKKAAKKTEEDVELTFGEALLALNAFLMNDKVPTSVRREVANMLLGTADRLAKSDWAGDTEGVLGAFSTGMVRVGAAPLSDAEDAAIQAAITALRFTGGGREEFLKGLAVLVNTLKADLDAANGFNGQHVLRIAELEKEVETGGDPADPTSPISVQRERDELRRRLDKIEAGLGIDLDGIATKDLESKVKKHVEDAETAAKATVTVPAAVDTVALEAAAKKEGADALAAELKPVFENLKVVLGKPVGKLDKNLQFGPALVTAGLDKTKLDEAAVKVGITA